MPHEVEQVQTAEQCEPSVPAPRRSGTGEGTIAGTINLDLDSQKIRTRPFHVILEPQTLVEAREYVERTTQAYIKAGYLVTHAHYHSEGSRWILNFTAGWYE